MGFRTASDQHISSIQRTVCSLQLAHPGFLLSLRPAEARECMYIL
jgi:hypothetical protein